MHRRRPVVACPPVIHYSEDGEEESFIKHRLLGYGGFAVVYEVERMSDGCRMAAKVLPLSSLADANKLRRVQNEIDINQLVHHPHIVTFLGSFQDEQNVYLLQELCCITLSELLKRVCRMTELQAAHILWQVLSALEHLHGCGVAHRDLKLSNMFLGRDGTVKVGDLGLACHLPSPTARRRSTCGSLNWMAPEVLRPGHSGYGLEVDIWALGVMLYTLLVGRPPFGERNGNATAAKPDDGPTVPQSTCGRILQGLYCLPNPSEVVLGPEARALVADLLSVNPSQRPTLAQVRLHAFFRVHLGALAAPLAHPQQLSLNQQLAYERQVFGRGQGPGYGAEADLRMTSGLAEATSPAPLPSEATDGEDSRPEWPAPPPAMDLRLVLCQAKLAVVAAMATKGATGDRDGDSGDSTSGSYMELSQSEHCSVATTATATTATAGGPNGDARWAGCVRDAMFLRHSHSYDPRRSSPHSQYPPHRLSEQMMSPPAGVFGPHPQPEQPQVHPQPQGKGSTRRLFGRGSVPDMPVGCGPCSMSTSGTDGPNDSTNPSCTNLPVAATNAAGPGAGGGGGQSPGAIATVAAASSGHCQASLWRWQDRGQLAASAPAPAPRALPGAGVDQDLPVPGGDFRAGPLPMSTGGGRAATAAAPPVAPVALSPTASSPLLRELLDVDREDVVLLGPSAAKSGPPCLDSQGPTSNHVAAHAQTLLQQHNHQQQQQLYGHRRWRRTTVHFPAADLFQAVHGHSGFEAPAATGGAGAGGISAAVGSRASMAAPTASGTAAGAAPLHVAFLSQYPGPSPPCQRRLQSCRSAQTRHSTLGTVAIMRSFSNAIGVVGADWEGENDGSSDTIRSYADSLEAMLMGGDSRNAAALSRHGPAPLAGAARPSVLKAAGPLDGSLARAPLVPARPGPIVLRHGRSSTGAPACRGISAAKSRAVLLPSVSVPLVMPEALRPPSAYSASSAPCVHPELSDTRGTDVDSALGATAGASESGARLLAGLASGPDHSGVGDAGGGVPSQATQCDSGPLSLAVFAVVAPAKATGPPRPANPPSLQYFDMPTFRACTPGREEPGAEPLLPVLGELWGTELTASAGMTADRCDLTPGACQAPQPSEPSRGFDEEKDARSGGCPPHRLSRDQMPPLALCTTGAGAAAAGAGASCGAPHAVPPELGFGSVGPAEQAAGFTQRSVVPGEQRLGGERGAALPRGQGSCGQACREQVPAQGTTQGLLVACATCGSKDCVCSLERPLQVQRRAPNFAHEYLHFSKQVRQLLQQQMRSRQEQSHHKQQQHQEHKQQQQGIAGQSNDERVVSHRGQHEERTQRQQQQERQTSLVDPEPDFSFRMHPWRAMALAKLRSDAARLQRIQQVEGAAAAAAGLEVEMEADMEPAWAEEEWGDSGSPITMSHGVSGPLWLTGSRPPSYVLKETPQGLGLGSVGPGGAATVTPPTVLDGGARPPEASPLSGAATPARQCMAAEGSQQRFTAGPSPSARPSAGGTAAAVAAGANEEPWRASAVSATRPPSLASTTGSASGSSTLPCLHGAVHPASGDPSLVLRVAAASALAGVVNLSGALRETVTRGPQGATSTPAADARSNIGGDLPVPGCGPGTVVAARASSGGGGTSGPATHIAAVGAITLPQGAPPGSAHGSSPVRGVLANGWLVARGPPPSAPLSAFALALTAAPRSTASPPRRLRASFEVEQVLRHLESREGDELPTAAFGGLAATTGSQTLCALSAPEASVGFVRPVLAPGLHAHLTSTQVSTSISARWSDEHPGLSYVSDVGCGGGTMAAAARAAEAPAGPAALTGTAGADGSRSGGFSMPRWCRQQQPSPPPGHHSDGLRQATPLAPPGSLAVSAGGGDSPSRALPEPPPHQHLQRRAEHDVHYLSPQQQQRQLEPRPRIMEPQVLQPESQSTDDDLESSAVLLHTLDCSVHAKAEAADAAAAAAATAGEPACSADPQSPPSPPPPSTLSAHVQYQRHVGAGSALPWGALPLRQKPSLPLPDCGRADREDESSPAVGAAGCSAAGTTTAAPRSVLGSADTGLPEMDPDALAELASRLRTRSFMDSLCSSRNGSFTYRPSRMMPATHRSSSQRGIAGLAPAPGPTTDGDAAAAATAGDRASPTLPPGQAQVQAKDVLMVKWLDYSAKYGLSYVLSNGAVGVLFRDGTQLIRDYGSPYAWLLGSATTGGSQGGSRHELLLRPQPLPPQAQALLLGAQPLAANATTEPRQHDTAKKLKLLVSFESMLLGPEGAGGDDGSDEPREGCEQASVAAAVRPVRVGEAPGPGPHGHLRAGHPTPSHTPAGPQLQAQMQDQQEQQQRPTAGPPLPPAAPAQPPVVIVTWWMRTRKALVLCMSSGTLQALFCDGSELVVREVDDEVDFLARDGRRTVCSLRAVRTAGPKDSITKRIQYAMTLLDSRTRKHA